MDKRTHIVAEDYSPEKAGAMIEETRLHLAADLLPACDHDEFSASFLRYLDTWAIHFRNNLSAPLEMLAFAVRNLLEFSILLPAVFESENGTALFLNEALRLDLSDLDQRVPLRVSPTSQIPPPSFVDNFVWLPMSTVRVKGKREKEDEWCHKYCSKLMHPSAVMILAPEAVSDPIRRVVLSFDGVRYLNTSYSYMSNVVLGTTSTCTQRNTHEEAIA